MASTLLAELSPQFPNPLSAIPRGWRIYTRSQHFGMGGNGEQLPLVRVIAGEVPALGSNCFSEVGTPYLA